MPKKYMTIIFTIITVAIAIFGYIKYINLNQRLENLRHLQKTLLEIKEKNKPKLKLNNY